jgi:hypothetical protein
MSDGVGKMENACVVGHHNHPAVGLHRGRDEQLHHSLARGVVERGGRLIAENQAGLVHKCAGERNALLLAPRKRLGKRVEPILQAKPNKKVLRLRDGLAPLNTSGKEGDRCVLGGGERAQ